MKIIKKFTAEVISVIMCISMLQPIIVSAQTEKNEIINADIYVNLSEYVPTISGTISCSDGKMVTLNINNITNNTVIANQIITAEAGNQNISYTLPSLVSSKEYEVIISCEENGNSLAYMSVILDSSIIAVNITGTATTANTVDINASLQTTNTGLVDKNVSFTGNKELSTTIPNLLPSASFHLTAVGYETITIPDTDPTPTPSPDITAQIEKTGNRLIVTGNISSGGNKQVTILVTAPNDEIVYIDQKESGENGEYTFDFGLPLNAGSGEYNVKVGGGGISPPLTLSFMHMSETGPDATPEPSPTPTPSPDITAQIEKTGNRLIVTGNISSVGNKQVTILVTAPNDEIVYIDQKESGENGEYTFDFGLPLNAGSGEYSVKVGGGGISPPLTLSFMHMSETGPDAVDTEYVVTRNSNDEFRLVIGAINISSFNGKVYVLDYDSDVIVPTSYRGLQYDNSVELGLHNNINIISDTGGKIRFSIVNPAIPPNKVWNGLINVFKFKFISDIGGITKILFYEEQ